MRSATLHVRMTEEEYAAANAHAAAAGVTLSAYIRRRALSNENRSVIQTDPETLKGIYANLRRCGGLLNQACRALNRGSHDPALDGELQRAMALVASASGSVAQFIADARDSI